MSGKRATTPTPPDGDGPPVPHGPRAALLAVREGRGGLVALALVVGAAAGVGAIVFRWLIRTFALLLSGRTDYSDADHDPNPRVPWLGPYFVLLSPVVVGLLCGSLVQRFAREARGHGVPEVMYAVARRGGRIAPQVAVVKSPAFGAPIHAHPSF